MAFLEIRNLSASYGTVPVLSDVSLSVERGAMLGLIGPSGSGKSTLLRSLVGLLPPSSGQVLVEGTAIDYRRREDLKAVRDRFAIVFQQFNLFQNMSAIENVTIAPVKVKGRPKDEARAEGERLLAKVGLGHKLDAYPDELSGGQQQRVAIARALALKPDVLLLDEVTASLDPELVSEVLDTIRALAADGMTILIVSHEMSFIRGASSEVAFMAEGRVVEIGDPASIFVAPRESRTRDFVDKILHH
jgi:polar amino acid transport system ATP-binding protein